MRLVAHVLLATERATVRHQRHGDLIVGDHQHAGDVVAVVPHTLTTGVHLEMPHTIDDRRHGQRALRFEERMLDALRVEDLVHRVSGIGKTVVDVAARVLADAQHVGGGSPHSDRRSPPPSAAAGSVTGVSTSYPTSISVCRIAGLLARLGDDDRQQIAGVARATADRDHDRPVLVDDADAQFAGDVGSSEHRDHTRRGRRRRRVDRRDLGACVRR